MRVHTQSVGMVSVPEHAMDEVPLEDEDGDDSMEYRLFMAYAQRSRSHRFHVALPNGKEERANRGAKETKDRHKKSRWPKVLTPACLRPQRVQMRGMGLSPERVTRSSEDERAGRIASQAQRIVQRVKQQEEATGYRMLRRGSSIQHDGEDEDEIIANIVQILRTFGDRLDDKIKEERSLNERIRGMWSYDFYKKVTECFLSEAVPGADTEEEQQTNKIAMCLHVTTAMTALENHPMCRVYGFGARYLKENYSPWIQSRGGWEKVMGVQNEDDDEEEVE